MYQWESTLIHQFKELLTDNTEARSLNAVDTPTGAHTLMAWRVLTVGTVTLSWP